MGNKINVNNSPHQLAAPAISFFLALRKLLRAVTLKSTWKMIGTLWMVWEKGVREGGEQELLVEAGQKGRKGSGSWE